MRVGRIKEIWRYPVKSMGGERLPHTRIDAGGIPGDRAWAVRDEVRGGIRGAKKIPALMSLDARYLESPERGRVPAPEITLPGGERVRADAPEAAARVSAALGTRVTLWPLLAPDQLEHYRRGAPDHADPLRELRAVFGREEGEPLPDLTGFPRELFQYESPPGTYFDAFPLLLLSTASLERLAKAAPASAVDVRRFRPNLVIETAPGLEGYVEAGWAGGRLRIGGVEIEATLACPRCVMVTHGFADLPPDAGLLRSIVSDAGQNLGVYGRCSTPGAVSLGDPVELIESPPAASHSRST